jgi:hypothetical protein
MAVDLATAKAQLNLTTSDDDALVTRLIAAAEDFIIGQTGRADLFSYVDASVDHAVLMMVGHFYANREATLVGVTAAEMPLGVCDIINNNRNWSWGE